MQHWLYEIDGKHMLSHCCGSQSAFLRHLFTLHTWSVICVMWKGKGWFSPCRPSHKVIFLQPSKWVWSDRENTGRLIKYSSVTRIDYHEWQNGRSFLMFTYRLEAKWSKHYSTLNDLLYWYSLLLRLQNRSLTTIITGMNLFFNIDLNINH